LVLGGFAAVAHLTTPLVARSSDGEMSPFGPILERAPLTFVSLANTL
jgi:hypothetical protein